MNGQGWQAASYKKRGCCRLLLKNSCTDAAITARNHGSCLTGFQLLRRSPSHSMEIRPAMGGASRVMYRSVSEP